MNMEHVACRMEGKLVNDKLEESGQYCYMVLFRNLPGGSEKRHGKHSKYESGR
jgi:hypothetical protein